MKQIVRRKFFRYLLHSFTRFIFQQERKDYQREMKANQFDEFQMDKHLNEVERQQYQDYTGRVITFMQENGRNTYPMKRVKKNFTLISSFSQSFALGCCG